MRTAELATLRPPLKWAGGKRWQVPHLRPIWAPHAHRRLVEPFCGGLAVTLGLMPARALLNDANPHVINFYRWLQNGLRVDLPMENDEQLFYRHRDRFNAMLSSGRGAEREAAALFYYLNRTGYNGLCRFNRSGEFNVPFGRYTRIDYTRDFTPYREAFAGWTFTTGDMESVPLERGRLRLRRSALRRRVHALRARIVSRGRISSEPPLWLATHPGPVVLVNQATDRVEKLYRKLGFDVRFLNAPRRISRTGDRTPAREIMATRNL